jgi:hypothetical protein
VTDSASFFWWLRHQPYGSPSNINKSAFRKFPTRRFASGRFDLPPKAQSGCTEKLAVPSLFAIVDSFGDLDPPLQHNFGISFASLVQ